MQTLFLLCLLLCLILAVHTQSENQNQNLQPFRPQQRRFIAEPQDPLDPFAELDLLDIVLVASVDGKFHALNRTSGHVLWSMSSFPDAEDQYANLTVPKTLGPLVRTVHPGVSDDDEEETESAPAPAPAHEVFIIEPQSGDIYVLKPDPSGQAPLQRFPFSVPELVDMAPFPFSDPEAGYTRVFVGKKETSLLLVELETGRVKATVGAEQGWEAWEEEMKQEEEGMYGAVDLDELEDAYHFEEDDDEEKPPKAKPTEVYIGRTDYYISIHTRPLSPSSPPPRNLPPTQNLSFSTYGPPTQDLLLQAAYTRPKDGAYVQSLPGGEVVSFRAWQSTNAKKPSDNNNDSTNTNPDMPLLWLQEFQSPIVATFDVLRRSSPHQRHSHGHEQPQHLRSDKSPDGQGHTFVLLQPQPGLHDFHPSLAPLKSSGDDAKANSGMGSGAHDANANSGAQSDANANANDSDRSSTHTNPNPNLPNADAAYVGIVEETGSLFAMSPARFPFVAFGGYESGAAKRGRNKTRGRGMRMIEAGPGKHGDEEEGPLGVDEITRRRKERLEKEKEATTTTPNTEHESSSEPSPSPKPSVDADENEDRQHQPKKESKNANICPPPRPKGFDFECLVGMRKLEENPQEVVFKNKLGSGYPLPPGYRSGLGYPYSYSGGGLGPGLGGLPTSPSQRQQEYRYYGEYDPNHPIGLLPAPPASSDAETLPSSRAGEDTVLVEGGGRDRDNNGISNGSNDNEPTLGPGTTNAVSWSEQTALAAVVFCVLGLSVVWVWIGKLRRGTTASSSSSSAQNQNVAKAQVPLGITNGDGDAITIGNGHANVIETLSIVKPEIDAGAVSETESGSGFLQLPSQGQASIPSSPSASPKSTPRRRRQQRQRTTSSVSGDATDTEYIKLPTAEELEEVEGEGEGEVEGGEGDENVEGEGVGEKKKKVRRGGRGRKKKGQNQNQNQNQNQQQPQQRQAATPTPVSPTPTQPRTAGGIPGGGGVVVVPSAVPAMGTGAVEPHLQSSLIVSDTVLGFGSHGTVVYSGSLQGRAVAVKRLLSSFVTLAAREVSILQESDDHPNVVRYYYQETARGGEFMYIALELCLGTLAEVVEGSSAWTPGMGLNLNLESGDGVDAALGSAANGKADLANIRESVMRDPKKALAQITRGLRHLHALKLVHRDIKPQNILVARAIGKPPLSKSKSKSSSGSSGNAGGGYRMLISDFGLCKKLDVDQTSFLPTAQGAMAAGTVGWRAPEILKGEVRFDFDDVDSSNDAASRGSTSTVTGGSVGSNSTASGGGTRSKPTRLTKSVDIFALGCLFYYVLTGGGHPYGDRFEREVNILKDAKCLDGLEKGWEGGFGSGNGGGDVSDGAAEEGTEAANLIRAMLEMESASRPDTERILLHPFFWDAGKRLNFLQDASDRFEIMPRGDAPVSKSASSSKPSLQNPKSNVFTPYEGDRDPHLIRLEEGSFDIVGTDWHSRCDKVFVENLGKFRKYDGKSVQDLLRALRNKKHHYQDLPENVKRHLGSMPEGYLSYFTRRFPRLFLHVHRVIGTSELNREDMFRSYFELEE
ncbi:bifunctional endoribonuclease/protein kinase ire1 [Stygiomarasmius scandens]|uniref:Bifunctional endoribonuclease/protein kinase ire1 n=1 Tax=Marasmiellus scandens TaxID=2682957 RepID=A0ABR1IJ92_9AGAR